MAPTVIDVSPGTGTGSEAYKPLVTADSLDDLTPQERQAAEAEAVTLDYGKEGIETSEKAAMLQEQNQNNALVKASQFDNQGELVEFRPGRIMHHTEFLHRLKQLRPDAYLNDFSNRGLIGLNLIQNGKPSYVCGVQAGWANEWSQLRVDENGMPREEAYRGWRTVLLRLILQDLVDETEVHHIFGRPEGQFAGRYLSQLQAHRTAKLGLA